MSLSRDLINYIRLVGIKIEGARETRWKEDSDTLEQGIHLINEVLEDPMMGSLVTTSYEYFQAHLQKRDSEIMRIMEDSESRADFLAREKELLSMPNFSHNRSEELISDAKQIVEGAPGAIANPVDIFQSVNNLKVIMVEVNNHEIEEEEIKKISWLKFFGKLALSFGGAVLMIANPSGLAVSLGITTPMSTLSVLVGGTICTDAAKEAAQELSKRN